MKKTLDSKQLQTQKPYLTQEQILQIHWIHNPKDKNAICIGKYKEYWVLSQNLGINSPVLVYNQDEWDAFIDGVKNKEFDDLTNT